MIMGIYQLIVKRIYDLCKEKDITPNALSYLAGISQSTVKSILNGESKNPGIVTIKKICDGFNISIVDFFDTEDFRNLEQEFEE
ncbi:MAG TPA: transcriptional regulator [Ruminococcaceae bacterium]|nr:transcriptional regulator [Oscillospiraceae bacterium]